MSETETTGIAPKSAKAASDLKSPRKQLSKALFEKIGLFFIILLVLIIFKIYIIV
jgi:hypothetical protein